MCVLPFLYFFVLFHFRVPNICVKNKQNKKGKLYVDDLLVSVTFVTWEDYSEDFFFLGYWNKHVFLLFIWIHWIRSLLGCQKLYSYIVVYHLQVMTHWVLSEPLFPPIGYHKIKTFDDFSFQRKSCWFCIYYNVFEVEIYCPNLSTFIAWDESSYIVRGAHS